MIQLRKFQWFFMLTQIHLAVLRVDLNMIHLVSHTQLLADTNYQQKLSKYQCLHTLNSLIIMEFFLFCLRKFSQLQVFDRKLQSSLSMSFFLLLLLLRHFVKFSSWMRNLESLIVVKKTGKSYLGQENRKILSWMRKPECLILDKKTRKSYLG